MHNVHVTSDYLNKIQSPSRLIEEYSCVRPHDVSPRLFLTSLFTCLGPSGWGGSSPTSPTVDNGTAAWGKPSDAPTGWGDPDDTGEKTTGWGNHSPNPIKSG